MAYIKINRDKFYHNLNQLALKAGSKDKIAVVLKDNAYGHGLEQMAKLSQEYGIKQAVVVTQNEANSIKEFFENILILNSTPLDDKKFSYAITSLEALKDVCNKAKLELKIDTGMHRNGISMNEIHQALELIKSKNLNLTGIMTHFRSADVLSSELAWQQNNFNKIKAIAKEYGFENIRFHSHNSAALLRNKKFTEDMARVGIAIYGYNELPNSYKRVELKPIIELWAKKSSTRILKKGQRVGYGGDFIATKDMKISTYDLGYGDGWRRDDSKHPYYTVDNLPILGRVSMDFISLKSDKDEICILNDAKKAAKHYGTISYEITTALSSEIERIIV